MFSWFISMFRPKSRFQLGWEYAREHILLGGGVQALEQFIEEEIHQQDDFDKGAQAYLNEYH